MLTYILCDLCMQLVQRMHNKYGDISEDSSLLCQFAGLVAQVDKVIVPRKCDCREYTEDGFSGTRLTESYG
jgi:hypothetical protein